MLLISVPSNNSPNETILWQQEGQVRGGTTQGLGGAVTPLEQK